MSARPKKWGYLRSLRRYVGIAWRRFWFKPADRRTASLIRVLAGCSALTFLLSYTSDLIPWFGPAGVLPFSEIRFLLQESDEASQWYGLSLLRAVTTRWELVGLHSTALVLAGCFTAGIAPRATGLLTWLIVLSYLHRAPIVTSQFEPLLAMLLAYSWWSLPAPGYGLTKQCSHRPSVAANLTVRLVQVHLVGFYLLSALSKLGGVVWWNGEAVWWLVAQPDSPLINLAWLRNYPTILHVWTHATVLVELTFPILIWNRRLRPLVIAASWISWGLLAIATGRVAFCALMALIGFAFVTPQDLPVRLVPSSWTLLQSRRR